MAVALPDAFLREVKKKGMNKPNTIVEVFLDSGTVKWGIHEGGFPDVQPILNTVTSRTNKLDIKKGYLILGTVTITIVGRDNFKNLLRDEYVKNRLISLHYGFVAPGYLFSEYVNPFTGKILDWSRQGDTLTLTVGDDLMVDAKLKIPEVNSTKTQILSYRGVNPADIKLDIMKVQMGIPASRVDTTGIEIERDTWLAGMFFHRDITKPTSPMKLLSELMTETNSYLINTGQKTTLKYFGPPLPGENVPEWSDDFTFLPPGLTVKSGYTDRHFTQVEVYFDHDEDGGTKFENYDSVAIETDSSAQSSGEWDQKVVKVIKSSWIKSFTYTQESNVTGVTLYHISRFNGAGTGTISYNYTNNTLTWTPPGGSAGAVVTLNDNGKYQLFGADTTKYVRVVLEVASLPVSNQSDDVVITPLPGATYASTLGNKLLQRFRDPVPSGDGSVDINDVSIDGNFMMPTSGVNMTTDDMAYKSAASLNKERFMLTAVTPDWATGIVKVAMVKGGMPADNTENFGFISPTGTPDYEDATELERGYAFIGRDSDNKVYAGASEGYVKGAVIQY